LRRTLEEPHDLLRLPIFGEHRAHDVTAIEIAVEEIVTVRRGEGRTVVKTSAGDASPLLKQVC
jgi:hypothetical protein